MKTRRDQGFTVLQMVVLDPEYNEDMRNPCGIPALNNGNILDPNEAYFSYVDWVLDQAETGECSTFSYWTPEDAWIGFTMLQSGHGLYKKNYELIEAERVPKHVTAEDGIPSDDAEGTVMTGAAASSDGTSAAGGTASAGSTAACRELVYPVWDGEPAYEMMPTCWPVKDLNSFHGTYMVRKRAYWGLLAGAFGHTYGHASVWNTATEKEKNVICRFSWTEAIQSDGSKQMKILRDFLEAYPLAYFEPCQERLLRQASAEDVLDLHEQAALRADSAQMLVYFAAETQERIQAGDIFEGAVYGAWFDPKDGSLTAPENLRPCVEDGILSVKNDSSDGEDRVLILSADPSGIAVPSLVYGGSEEDGELRKVFEW